MVQLRTRAWSILEVACPEDKVSRYFDIFIIILIALNVLAVVLETVDSIATPLGPFFSAFEFFSVIVFSIEYLARLWSCVASKKYQGALSGRLRWARSPMAIVDLLAVLPFFLPFFGADLRFLRALRLFRLFRILKLGRYSQSILLIQKVVSRNKEPLVITSFTMLLLLILSASTMYFIEHPHQPAVFPSIPATMWWAIATLTTVGYGDVYPVTGAGRLLGSLVAIFGIGFLPCQLAYSVQVL